MGTVEYWQKRAEAAESALDAAGAIVRAVELIPPALRGTRLQDAYVRWVERGTPQPAPPVAPAPCPHCSDPKFAKPYYVNVTTGLCIYCNAPRGLLHEAPVAPADEGPTPCPHCQDPALKLPYHCDPTTGACVYCGSLVGLLHRAPAPPEEAAAERRVVDAAVAQHLAEKAYLYEAGSLKDVDVTERELRAAVDALRRLRGPHVGDAEDRALDAEEKAKDARIREAHNLAREAGKI